MSDELTWLRDRLEAMTPAKWRGRAFAEGRGGVWAESSAAVFTCSNVEHADMAGVALLRNLAPAMLAVVEAMPDVECCNFPPGSEFNCYEIEREPYHDFPCLACAKERFLAAVREEQNR